MNSHCGGLGGHVFHVLLVFVYDVVDNYSYWIQPWDLKGTNHVPLGDPPASLTLLSVLWEQVC